MKKIIILILLFISTISFGQNSEYKKAQKLVKDKMYTEANILFEKLLNKEFGELDEITQLNCLTTNANCYFALNDYKTAYDKYTLLLKFIKSIKIEIPNKDEYVAGVIKFMDDLKSKIPQDSNSSSAVVVTSESNSTTNTDSSKPASYDKTVTLTVSGTGKTLEEARLNALRSAIEQAFGAFISSKTEILNDNLVKDEIVSIASGNVQKYEVVSQVELPNLGYAITLSATVSIDKLTSFAESKGVVVEFKGGMFGATIKLQKLNEESEYVAIKNLLVQTLTVLESAYDYSLNVNEPKLIEGDKYFILFEISANKNDNYDNLWNFFKKTIRQISLSEVDASAIKNTGKKIFYLQVDTEKLKLRNRKSLNLIFNFSMISSLLVANSFYLENNLGTVKIKNNQVMLFTSFTGEYRPGNSVQYENFDDPFIMTKPEVIVINENGKDYNFLDYIKLYNFDIIKLIELKIYTKEYDSVQLWDSKNRISIKTPINFKTQYDEYNIGNNSLQFKINYNLLDLEKIQSFKIEKKPFIELMNNYESYRE